MHNSYCNTVRVSMTDTAVVAKFPDYANDPDYGWSDKRGTYVRIKGHNGLPWHMEQNANFCKSLFDTRRVVEKSKHIS